MRIADVIEKLTDGQKRRLANVRGKSVERLANSYRGDWLKLIADMKQDELLRALRALPERELRVVALRAFDGYASGLGPGKAREAKGIVRALYGMPLALQERTWKDHVAKRLRDEGLESDKVPAGLRDKVRLRRIFPEVP